MRHVLFGFIGDELLCVPHVCCYLLSLLKFFVSFQGLIARIKGRLSFYLSLLIKRFRSRRRRRFFQRQGGANGRIGKVVGDIHSFVSFLVSFERVSLACLCWLYCGLLGSISCCNLQYFSIITCRREDTAAVWWYWYIVYILV